MMYPVKHIQSRMLVFFRLKIGGKGRNIVYDLLEFQYFNCVNFKKVTTLKGRFQIFWVAPSKRT